MAGPVGAADLAPSRHSRRRGLLVWTSVLALAVLLGGLILRHALAAPSLGEVTGSARLTAGAPTSTEVLAAAGDSAAAALPSDGQVVVVNASVESFGPEPAGLRYALIVDTQGTWQVFGSSPPATTTLGSEVFTDRATEMLNLQNPHQGDMSPGYAFPASLEAPFVVTYIPNPSSPATTPTSVWRVWLVTSRDGASIDRVTPLSVAP